MLPHLIPEYIQYHIPTHSIHGPLHVGILQATLIHTAEVAVTQCGPDIATLVLPQVRERESG